MAIVRRVEGQGRNFMASEMREHCARHKHSDEGKERIESNAETQYFILWICCAQKPHVVISLLTRPIYLPGGEM